MCGEPQSLEGPVLAGRWGHHQAMSVGELGTRPSSAIGATVTHDPWCPLRHLALEVGAVASQGRAQRLSCPGSQAVGLLLANTGPGPRPAHHVAKAPQPGDSPCGSTQCRAPGLPTCPRPQTPQGPSGLSPEPSLHPRLNTLNTEKGRDTPASFSGTLHFPRPKRGPHSTPTPQPPWSLALSQAPVPQTAGGPCDRELCYIPRRPPEMDDPHAEACTAAGPSTHWSITQP